MLRNMAQRRRMTLAEQPPPQWVRDLCLDDLEDLFGQESVALGAELQRTGAVLTMLPAPKGQTIVAIVQGERRHTTFVEPSHHRFSGHAAPDVASRCSCPMGGACEHVVAVILQARIGAPRPAARPPAWESLLNPMVTQSHDRRTDCTPLALHFEVANSAGRPSLRLRPLMLGDSGAWIRTGISWSDVQYASRWRHFLPEQQEALASLVLAARARSASYYSPGALIPVESIGPSLWRILDEAVAAGVALVTGPKGKLPVTISSEPARIVLDTHRDGPDSDILLRPRFQMDEVDEPGLPMGAPAYGVFVRSRDGLILARLHEPLSTPLASLLDKVDTVTIPAHDATRFLAQYYPALRQHATVESSDGSVDLPVIQPPRLALTVTFSEDHTTHLLWAFRYPVGDELLDVPLIRPALPEQVSRDAAAEESLLTSLAFLQAIPGLTLPMQTRDRPGIIPSPTLQGWQTIEFLRDALPALQGRDDIDVTIVGFALDYVEFEDPPLVSVSTHDLADSEAQDDWFDLQIVVTVGDKQVPLVNLLTAVARGDGVLILPDGTWFSLDRPELHSLRRIVEEARALQDRQSDDLRINRYQAGLWEELVSIGVVAQQSQRWQDSVTALLALEELPHPAPPEKLAATLRPYQLDGYQWLSFLWDHQLGGILADDMGLGKTLQTLAMAERARAAGTLSPETPILVVAPTSVVGTWQREAATFTPELNVVAVTQTARKAGVPLAKAAEGAHVVITSYALFRIDADEYNGMGWSALILDEAQFVKNHQARTYQVARRLAAPVKIAITGTPLENSLMDLWSLLSIAAPGLFPQPERFGEIFRKPIENGSSPDLLGTLRRRIRPLMLRRTKEAVAADLPPKVEQVISVPLSAAHQRIYDTHLHRERQRILGLLDDVDRNRVAILSALTQLRQLSLDVHLVEPDAPANIHSAKVEALIDQLVEVIAEGHRCLVFSQFTRFLKIVRERLDAEGIQHVYLDGRTRDRPKRIAEFTDGDAPVFLISLKAGGSGLTLTQADYVFVLDPWWNPAVEAQAIDRTHRIGQDKTVMVYRLVSEGTIEEKVVAMQERKRELFSRVVDEGGLIGAPMSAEDLRGLLEG